MSSGKPLSKMHQRLNADVKQRAVLGAPVKGGIAPNTFWDDAQNLFVESIGAIEATHGELAKFLRDLIGDPERMSVIKDAATLVANINLLTRDIGEHKDRLEAIHKEHEGRSGGTTTPDDHMAVIAINGKYADALEVYNTTIMPTVSHIFEQIGAVDELLMQQALAKDLAEREAAELAARRLADPAFISDIEVKEVKQEIKEA